MNRNLANRNDQEYLVQKIRTQYTEPQHTGLDELKVLDRRVKAPANAFAYVFGCVSSLIMGAGMSLFMTDIGKTVGLASPMVPGLLLGLVGLFLALANYPIHKRILARRKKQYAQEILALSDRITKN